MSLMYEAHYSKTSACGLARARPASRQACGMRAINRVFVRSVSIISIFEFQFESLKSEDIYCGCFVLTRYRISMCQGLGPKNTMTFRKSTVLAIRVVVFCRRKPGFRDRGPGPSGVLGVPLPIIIA